MYMSIAGIRFELGLGDWQLIIPMLPMQSPSRLGIIGQHYYLMIYNT